MFKNLIVFLSFISIVACGSKPRVHIEEDGFNLTPTLQHEIIAKEIVKILENYSYKKVRADDSLSNLVFTNLLNSVDQGKNYLLQEDIDTLARFKTTISQDLKNGDLSTPFYLFNIYSKRYLECLEYALTQVDVDHDFDEDETYVSYREKLDWFPSEKELKDQWRKRVKFDLLNLKLTSPEGTNEDEKHKETLRKRYNNLLSQAKKINSNDAFQMIMSSYTDAIDPHTAYFNPSFAQAFNESMSNTLEGIGARLQMENEMVTIKEVIAGGPAFKDKSLKMDDRIIGVAQDDGEFEDIVGWRLDAAVAKIKGPEGTVVRLKILPAGQDISSQPTIVSLTREKIVIEEESAKKKIKIVTGDDGKDYKVGIISLPKFYIDFAAARRGDPNYKSTTRDVSLILDSLKEENVDAVLLDLRNNGGGSLQEAIELTGLFIDQGPVVQVRQANNAIDVERDTKAGAQWEGPFGVIINRFSASASEIFAGAIQDYGRGVVLGSTTFGKGTVQNAVNMERFITPTNKLLLKASKDNAQEDAPVGAPEFGQINVTIAKFYRINGSSTQHKGVEADITFPTQYSAERFGESAEKAALPWDQIKSTKYNKITDLSEINDSLLNMHQKRIANSEEYAFLLEDIEEFNKLDSVPQISLNLKKFKEERNENKEKSKIRLNRLLELNNMPVWEEGQPRPKVEFDFILDESLNIMADLIQITNK